jgi:hypothetical protein
MHARDFTNLDHLFLCHHDHEHLRELREELQAPIVYCRYKKSFYYSKSFNLEIRIINDPLQDPNR